MFKRALALGCVLAALGCADEFDSYYEIKHFRLLALQAEPPTLRQDEQTTLSALVTEDDATYQWSWCPFSSGSGDGYECAISHDDLQAAVDQALGQGQVDIPSYDLGTDPTATFAYDFPSAVVAGLCQVILSGDLPEGVPVPTCDGGFDIQIALETSSSGVDIKGVRDLTLLYEDDAEDNANPVITAVTAVNKDTGEEIELSADAPTTLERDVVYELHLDIDEGDAETYMEIPVGETEPKETRERLAVTWFRDSGTFEHDKTGFLDGADSFDTLTTNEWTTPTVDDYEDPDTRLFMVVRDNRGGVGFIARDIDLGRP